jgi:hypothetical protein
VNEGGSEPDVDRAEAPAIGDEAVRPVEPPAAPELGRRPLVERLGLTLVALVIAALFGGMGVAAWGGHEVFLAVMAWVGALMTLWAAASTLFRG